MSDISLPAGIGVALGIYLTFIVAGLAFLLGLVVAGIAMWRAKEWAWKEILRFELGPLACAACGGLYVCLALSGGQRAMEVLDGYALDFPVISLAVGGTVAIAVETRRRLRSTARPTQTLAGAAALGTIVAAVVAVVGKAFARSADFDFGFSDGPFVLGLSAFAALLVVLVGGAGTRQPRRSSYSRTGQTGRSRG